MMNEIYVQHDKPGNEAVLSQQQEHGHCSFVSRFLHSVRTTTIHIHICSFNEKVRGARQALVDSNLLSMQILLLAMPLFGIMIQCALFLFGKTCSPFPMWFSFLLFSLLALQIHWKCLLKFWGLVFLALLLTAYTFSYTHIDAECYHIPMQMLLKEGWNPVFDSTIEKLGTIADTSTFWDKHTLFLPKTVALCGALVSLASGLWIADSFLGYILFFVLFLTSYDFAKRTWGCNFFCSILFAAALSIKPKYADYLFSGLIDFHAYSALATAFLALFLYYQHFRIHDFVLAILATAISSTIKTTGLINCILLWGLFAVLLWERKEVYLGILSITILVAWIGISPLVTSWIQYGSPFYPSMTFDPRTVPINITADFTANGDGEQMGYVARFVYAWVSPALAKKACALYYCKPDFNPIFPMGDGKSVNGLRSMNILLWGSIVLMMLAKKNWTIPACLYILMTLVIYPLKYIGYIRYFPQVWVVIPLGIYQFCFCPSPWLTKRKRLKKISQYCLLSFLLVLSGVSVIKTLVFQTSYIMAEGNRQNLLASIRESGEVFVLPLNSEKRLMLSRRLACEDVYYEFSQQLLDWDHFEEDVLFPFYIQYYTEFWRVRFSNDPRRFLHISKWHDIIKHFPHPLFHSPSKTPDAPLDSSMLQVSTDSSL